MLCHHAVLCCADSQGSRMRNTKTEFVSCPSCGRTLFDLQEVTEQIRTKTGHLPGKAPCTSTGNCHCWSLHEFRVALHLCWAKALICTLFARSDSARSDRADQAESGTLARCEPLHSSSGNRSLDSSYSICSWPARCCGGSAGRTEAQAAFLHRHRQLLQQLRYSWYIARQQQL